MANRKRIARKVGRGIRRETGIPFGPAMRFGKLYAKEKYMPSWDMPAICAPYFREIVWCDCCGPVGHEIVGPNGRIDTSELSKFIT